MENKLYVAYCPERVLHGNVIYELVHNDRVIGGLNSESTGKALEAIRRFGADKIKVLIGSGVYFESAYPFAKTPEDDVLREMTNRTLEAMKKDGTLKTISEKWFNFDFTVKY